MFIKKNKGVFLTICLMFIVFLYSCEIIPTESYYANDTEVYPELYCSGDKSSYTEESITEREGSYQDERRTLQILLDVANERRVSIEKVDGEIVSGFAYSRDFTFYDLSPIMMNPADRVNMQSVTRKEAVEDVKVLFEVLRYVYGGYLYFGGDEVFKLAKEQIVEDIQLIDDNISGMELSRILQRHLSPIINDHHFTISGLLFGSYYTFLVSRDVFFDKTNRGFRNRENGLYVNEVPGHDIADILRLQLDESGQHFYAPILMREGVSTAAQTLTIIYENNTREYIELRAAPLGRNVSHIPSSLTETSGFPVVSLTWMMGMSSVAHGGHARAFLDFAEKLSDESVVILDLRSNSGGTAILPLKWMYLITGEVVNGNYINLGNWSVEHEYPWTPHGDTPETNPFYFSDEDLEVLAPVIIEPTIINGNNVYNLSDRHIVEREQVLVVLVDRHTSSAGEYFVDLVFNVENTIVIGQNTFGVLTVDAAYPHLRMPNSGMPVRLGRSIMFWSEEHFVEGVGFRPDVWVTGCALTATIAMLMNEAC
ncbi:MAG: S41 family peptidase [Oscillospiraceae bacterium]|nr:S41 family peptidase [Oscillospiraceae bacterium]